MLYEKAKDCFLEDFKSLVSTNSATPARLECGLKIISSPYDRNNWTQRKGDVMVEAEIFQEYSKPFLHTYVYIFESNKTEKKNECYHPLRGGHSYSYLET
jgi:hypothetical protein